MAFAGKFMAHTIVASADLSIQTLGIGAIYKAIAMDDGDFAQNGSEADGLLFAGETSPNHVTIGYQGVMKYTAGLAIVAGARLTVTTSGYFITAVSGTAIIGKNAENAVGSGAIGTGLFNFTNPVFMTSCHGGTGA